MRPVEFGFLEELNTAKQRPLASFEPGRRGRGQLGATPVRSTGLKTTLGVPGWLSLMVGRSLKGGDRWKAVKTSTFKVKIKAGTIFRPCSCVAGVGRRNITSLAPLHLFWFCLFIYLSSRSVLLALPSGAVWCPQRGKKTCAKVLRTSECGGKVYLAGFSTHDSLLSLDLVMFVHWFSKRLLTFSFYTKYPLLPQGVVWGLENAFGESC